MPNEKLDYEKMFQALAKGFENKLREQSEYFAMAKEINRLKPYNDLVNARILDLKMNEQCAIFRHVLEINKISKALCKKYGWDEEIEPEAE